MLNQLFAFLLLVAFVCFIVGLVKPKLFNRIFKRDMSRKATSLVFGVSFLALSVLVAITSPPAPTTPANAKSSTASTKAASVTAKATPAQMTPAQLATLETAIQNNIVGQARFIPGLKLISAGDTAPILIDKNGDVDISIEVASPGSDDATNDIAISVIASGLIPDVFGHGYPISGMILPESYPDTDSYGNPYIHTFMALAIDNATYNKIDWKTFNPATLCNLLMQQRTQGIDTATICGSIQ